MGAFSTGTLFALLQGAFYQVVTQCITHHTVMQLQEKAAGGAVLVLDARQYVQFIHSLHLVCFVQVGKKFQQPAGTTPKQYERAQFMLDRLGLSVSPASLCFVATG